MANPLYKALGGNKNMFGAAGNISNLVKQYKDFRNTFQGDPQQKIQELLQSGQISQEQLDMAQQMAQQFKGFLG